MKDLHGIHCEPVFGQDPRYTPESLTWNPENDGFQKESPFFRLFIFRFHVQKSGMYWYTPNLFLLSCQIGCFKFWVDEMAGGREWWESNSPKRDFSAEHR